MFVANTKSLLLAKIGNKPMPERRYFKAIKFKKFMKNLKLNINVLENRDASFGGSTEVALSGSTCT
jgi:hypothetical protein